MPQSESIHEKYDAERRLSQFSFSISGDYTMCQGDSCHRKVRMPEFLCFHCKLVHGDNPAPTGLGTRLAVARFIEGSGDASLDQDWDLGDDYHVGTDTRLAARHL